MCDILIGGNPVEALMESDLALFPIAPNGMFYNDLPSSLFGNPRVSLQPESITQLNINKYLKQMTYYDVRGIVSSEYANPFVIAKTLDPNFIHPKQIYAFAHLILHNQKLSTPFSLFVENVLGIERPSEYNGSVFIDTTSTDLLCETTKQAFRDWGGTVIFAHQ